jgi:hypothetical protein
MCVPTNLFPYFDFESSPTLIPSAIALVADPVRNLNDLPRRPLAEFGTDDRLHIEVDVCGMTKKPLSLIANKIAQ